MSDHGVRYSTVLSLCMHQADKQYGMPARPQQQLAPQLAHPGTLPATSDHTNGKREGHRQSCEGSMVLKDLSRLSVQSSRARHRGSRM